MNKTMLITIAATVGVIALIYRVPEAKEALTGESGSFLPWF